MDKEKQGEMPPEIQSLIARCEANVISFTNDQMSAALHFAETVRDERNEWRRLWELYRQTEPSDRERGFIFGDIDCLWSGVPYKRTDINPTGGSASTNRRTIEALSHRAFAPDAPNAIAPELAELSEDWLSTKDGSMRKLWQEIPQSVFTRQAPHDKSKGVVADTIGGFPFAHPNCSGCGKPLMLENAWMTDGCPCNSRLGINSMNETRWRLLMELQQQPNQRMAIPQKVKGHDQI